MKRAPSLGTLLAVWAVGCGRVLYEPTDAARGMDAAVDARSEAPPDADAAPIDAPRADAPGDTASEPDARSLDAPDIDTASQDAPSIDTSSVDARGDAGPCAHITTTGEVARVPGHVAIGTGPFTFEGWVRTRSTGTYQLIMGDRVAGAGFRGYLFGLFSDGTPYVQLSDTPNHQAPPPLDDGTWHHVAVTRDATGVLTCFVDFAPFAMTDSPSLRDLPYRPELMIGEDPANRRSPFGGELYMLRTWTTVRSAAELRAAAVTPIAPTPGLVFEAPLDGVTGGNVRAWVTEPTMTGFVLATATPAVSVVAGCPTPP